MADLGEEFASGMLSTKTTFSLFVKGPLTADELGNLIRKLEIDRAALLKAERYGEDEEVAPATAPLRPKPIEMKRAPAQARAPAKPVQPPAPKVKTKNTTVGPDPFSPFCEEIVQALPALLKKYPKGPHTQQVADAVGAQFQDTRRALLALDKAGRIKWERRADSRAIHALPIGAEPVPCDLTSKQAKFLEAIVAVAKDDEAAISHQDLMAATGAARGEIGNTINALIKKRYLRLIDRGHGQLPSRLAILRPEPYRISEYNRREEK